MRILPPVIVSFAVTKACNLYCKHCYSDADEHPAPDELSTAEAKRVIEEIAAAGARLLIFDGGEPLMRPDIYELVAYARDKGLYPGMGTNATFITPEIAEKLAQAGIRALAISIDGSDAKTHDDFRGDHRSWEKALIGLRNVQQAGIPFQIEICVHQGNVAQFAAVAKMAKESGATAIEVFDYVPAGRGRKHPELALSNEQRRGLVEEIISHQLSDDMEYECNGIPQFWVQVEKEVPEEALPKFRRSCCGAGLRYCCILYDGTVYPCMVLQTKAGDVREQSFEQIWRHAEVFAILRDRDRLEGKCGRCDYRVLCGGARCRVYERTGSLTAEDDSCWFAEGELRR